MRKTAQYVKARQEQKDRYMAVILHVGGERRIPVTWRPVRTTYNKTISKGWGGERRRRKREGREGEEKEERTVGRWGCSKSLALGEALNWELRQPLPGAKCRSAGARLPLPHLCSHATLACTTGTRCMEGKGPSAINPEHTLLCAVLGETALSACSTIPGRTPCLSMCGPKKQAETSCPNFELMSSLPARPLAAEGTWAGGIWYTPLPTGDGGQRSGS